MNAGVYEELKDFLCKLEEKYEICDIYEALTQQKNAYGLKTKAFKLRQNLQSNPETREMLDGFKYQFYKQETKEFGARMFINCSFHDEVCFDIEFEHVSNSILDLEAYFFYNNESYELFTTEEETVESILKVLKILEHILESIQCKN